MQSHSKIKKMNSDIDLLLTLQPPTTTQSPQKPSPEFKQQPKRSYNSPGPTPPPFITNDIEEELHRLNNTVVKKPSYFELPIQYFKNERYIKETQPLITKKDIIKSP